MIEIEKPRIECIETPMDDSYGKYVIEPLERGYGNDPGQLSSQSTFVLRSPERLSHPSGSRASSMNFRPSPASRKTLPRSS
jgi:hypothetical protein